jgi:hypothetical protein
MLESNQIEELICLVAAMDRETLIEQFHNYHSRFPVDFTPDFLASTNLDRLRHIFVAMCLQCQRLPEVRTPLAA